MFSCKYNIVYMYINRATCGFLMRTESLIIQMTSVALSSATSNIHSYCAFEFSDYDFDRNTPKFWATQIFLGKKRDLQHVKFCIMLIKLFNYFKMHGVLLKLMLMLNPMLLQADQAQLITGQDSVLPLQ